MLFLAAALLAHTAADHNSHGWVMYFGDHPIGGKWSLHVEGQWRRADSFLRWQQPFARPAINYDLTPRLQVSQGYTFVKTFPYGDFPVRQAFDEHRVYQQAIYRQPFRRFRLQHRFRFEQRWIDVQRNVDPGPLPHEGWRFQQRLRWMTRVEVPVNARYYVAAYNELFLHMPPNLAPRLLDQNRAYGALGIHLNKALRMEIGYMNQYLVQRNGVIEESNHTMQLAFFSNARLRNPFRVR